MPQPPRPTLNARITPLGGLDILSRHEVAQLRDATRSGLHELLRQCALAVLASGSRSDDAQMLLTQHRDFDIQVQQQDRGIWLELTNAPGEAFVDGRMIRGIHELLFAVVRDIVYVSTQIRAGRFALEQPEGITNAVLEILRNARVLQARADPNIVVCWGGHSIDRAEYSYTKRVGYQLGLRGLDICTGCGPGAMKGPMKGAAIGHAKQRLTHNRYIGITEPGIIAAEPPNPIVNHLVIMPDIEKRLEAFVRMAHGIVVFPGGAGTAEEILYLLGILLHPDNVPVPVPLVFTGPEESAAYFEQIDAFLRFTLGHAVAQNYQIVIADPSQVGRMMAEGMIEVRRYRKHTRDAFFFNWGLTITPEFQQPFAPNHTNMAALDLRRGREPHQLAAALRRAFSGIVAGNVKVDGIRAIREHGPYQISGEPDLMRALDELLSAFVEQQRMKLPGATYQPCYQIAC